jgi:hypothetical protein
MVHNSVSKNNFDVLKIKRLFYAITNIIIIFIMLKNPILKVDLSRFFKNAFTCTRCLILQNDWSKKSFKLNT